jgi:hypothetical protein
MMNIAIMARDEETSHQAIKELTENVNRFYKGDVAIIISLKLL